VLKLLDKSDIVHFREWYIRTLDHKCSRKLLQKNRSSGVTFLLLAVKNGLKKITLLTEWGWGKYLKKNKGNR